MRSTRPTSSQQAPSSPTLASCSVRLPTKILAFVSADTNPLSAFGPDCDRQTRRTALIKTHEHGLDLARIACRTVELVLFDIREVRLPFSPSKTRVDAYFQDLPALGRNVQFDAYARLDSRQLELIRSLEWLTFDPSTYSEALSQANALTRFFLCAPSLLLAYGSLTPSQPLTSRTPRENSSSSSHRTSFLRRRMERVRTRSTSTSITRRSSHASTSTRVGLRFGRGSRGRGESSLLELSVGEC